MFYFVNTDQHNVFPRKRILKQILERKKKKSKENRDHLFDCGILYIYSITVLLCEFGLFYNFQMKFKDCAGAKKNLEVSPDYLHTGQPTCLSLYHLPNLKNCKPKNLNLK